MISALKWIRKGVAKETPDRFALTDAEYEAIATKIGANLSAAKSSSSSKSKASNNDDDNQMTKANAVQQQKTRKDIEDSLIPGLEEYKLEDYDDEIGHGSDGSDEDGIPQETAALFANIKGLTYYSPNESDPYLQMGNDPSALDSEELDEVRILPTDNLLLAAKTEDDMSHIEVYIYEEEEENLYVHHDIMLPSFPLCMEWLDFTPASGSSSTSPMEPGAMGNFVAIGTFDPQIEIWNLDSLDVMFPAAILGVSAEEALATLPKGKKKKRVAGARVHPDFHTDAVVALSWNTQARSILASGSADTSIKLWDLTRPSSALRSFIKHEDKVSALQWNPTSQSVLLSGGFDSKAFVFDTRAPDSNSASFQLDSDVECLSWDPFSPERFMVSTESGIVHCYDARSPSTPLFKLHAHDGPVSALDLSSAIKGLMVTGSSDKTVKVWNVSGSAPSCIASRDLATGSVFSATFSKDAPFHLAVGGAKGKLVLWNLENNAGIRKTFSLPTPSLTTAKKTAATKEIVGLADADEEEEEEGFEDITEEGEEEDEEMETDDEENV